MNYKFVNGVKIFSPSSRLELIDYALKEKKILIAINAEKILHASENFKDYINKNIGYPDGIGAVWALKKNGLKKVKKIPGCELWLDIIEESYKNKSFFLIGSKQEVITKTIENLKNNFKGINITGYRNGYFNNTEEDKIINDIVDLKPDIIFVALGSPRQEILMEKIYKRHKAVYQGLGGSFDVYTGNVKRAPKWWVNNNLEWAYRLFNQPSRISRQLHLAKFVSNLFFKY